MKAIALLLAIAVFGMVNVAAQPYSLYSNDALPFESKYLQGTIQLNLHLPETYAFSGDAARYPITIVFDSQHDRTYPQIIHSIDLLTSESQIPESIIVGVPFNSQNRRYLTSAQKIANDSLAGIERMELFLFEELIPLLQERYKGNDYLSVIGHSRTGFLVNYLSFRRPSQVNLAASLSGFFDDAPLTMGSFHSFLSDSTNFPNKFNYYYTAGTTLEESTYLEEFRQLNEMLKNHADTEQVRIRYAETPYANHITNYWVSVPPILMDAFSDYNAILDTWFFEKLESDGLANPVELFQADLEQAGKDIGVRLNPNLTHIYSLASHFIYSSNKDYQTAIEFFELGLAYYPDYLDFYVEMIEVCKAMEATDEISRLKSVLQEKARQSTRLSDSEREAYLEYIREN